MTDLLIGTYTSASMGGHGAGIMAARLAGDAVADVTLKIAATDPSFLAVAGSGAVYAVDETGNQLAAFTADGAPLGAVGTGGAAPCHVALSPDETFVLVAEYGSGSVSVHERLADGTLGERTAFVEHGAGAHAHMVAFDPDDPSVLLVPDLGLDAVFRYRLDADGRLTEAGRLSLPAGTGPRHVAFHDDHLYVLGELASTVTACERTADGWRAINSASTIPPEWTQRNQTAAIRAQGDRLFVSNRGHDSIAMFAVDPLPRLLDRVPAHGREPRDCVVTADGAQVVVANQHSDELAVFTVDADRLVFASAVPVPSPVCVVLVDAA